MSDNRKILRTLKNMPEYHMDSEAKNRILKNIKEQNISLEKKFKSSRLIGRITAGAAACVLAAVLLLAVFSPAGRQFLGKIWGNSPGQGQNLAEGDNGLQNPEPGDSTGNVNPVQNTPGADFTSIQMIDGSNGWAATMNNILHTTDGGNTWSDMTPEGITNGIKASFIDANQCYAAAPNSLDSPLYIYYTSDGGKSWSKVQSPENGYAMFQFQDAKNGWALLGQDTAMHHENVALLHTTGGNSAWSTVAKTDPQSTDDTGKLPFAGLKYGFYFVDDNNGWITGYIPAPGNAYLYNTKDGGHSWYEKSLPIPEGLKNADLTTLQPVFFTDKDGIIPVRANTDKVQYLFFITHDGGETWTAGDPVDASADQAFIYDFTDKDHGFGTNGKSMYTTGNGGLTWKASSTNISLDRTTTLNFISQNKGYAAVDGTLFKTVDGGLTWSELTNSPLRAPGIIESRVGKALPYSPEAALSQNTADTAKNLVTLYFEHYSDNSISDSDRLKSYTVNDVKIINDSDAKIVFSVDYSLQGIIDGNAWVSGNSSYAGDGMVKDGMFYITAEKRSSTLSMISISQDLP